MRSQAQQIESPQAGSRVVELRQVRLPRQFGAEPGGPLHFAGVQPVHVRPNHHACADAAQQPRILVADKPERRLQVGAMIEEHDSMRVGVLSVRHIEDHEGPLFRRQLQTSVELTSKKPPRAL